MIRWSQTLKQRACVMFSPGVLQLLACLLLVQVSALLVIYSTYENRRLFSGLEQLRDDAEEMQITWRQLLLEQSTLASFNHVSDVAQQHLAMTVPDPKQMIILKQGGSH